jgi:hypothetical protein
MVERLRLSSCVEVRRGESSKGYEVRVGECSDAKGSLPVGSERTHDCRDDPLNDHSRDRMHVIIIVSLDVITHH